MSINHDRRVPIPEGLGIGLGFKKLGAAAEVAKFVIERVELAAQIVEGRYARRFRDVDRRRRNRRRIQAPIRPHSKTDQNRRNAKNDNGGDSKRCRESRS